MNALPTQEHLPPGSSWRHPAELPSLPEVFRSVPVQGRLWRRLLAFVGPGYLVAVGYMDPGNWATDISAGALYNYNLLWVVLASNFLAMFLQALAARLGIVTGRDLAQACRDTYPRPVAVALWLSAEVGIVACDVAEVIGAAIALNLLFHLPLLWGVAVTALDVLLILAFQMKNRGFRQLEALVVALIGIMMAIFALELGFSHPEWSQVMRGFLPDPGLLGDLPRLYLALGILGATVMPHNLYLHSSIVQTRSYERSPEGVREAIRLAITDSNLALTLALFVNAAILVVAASAFYRSGHHEIGDIKSAYLMLTPLLGAALATPLFAVALLASGQNATLTGTLAGQIVLEGFMRVRMTPWARRLLSRSLAIVPSLFVVAYYGAQGTGHLLIFSQVVLSVQLPFAVLPLVHITSDASKMGPYVNSKATRTVGWLLGALIAGLNAYLVWMAWQGV